VACALPYVGSRTRDRAKQGPGRVENFADTMIFNQSTGKSVSFAHAARVGMEKHAKNRSVLHLTSRELSSRQHQFPNCNYPRY
jgi:hypothetical protein